MINPSACVWLNGAWLSHAPEIFEPGTAERLNLHIMGIAIGPDKGTESDKCRNNRLDKAAINRANEKPPDRLYTRLTTNYHA